MSKVPAATHTLAILRLLMTTDAPISAARIAAQLRLPRSTTYQLLKVMVDAGFVMHLKSHRTYGLGAAAYSLAQAYSTQQPLVRASTRHAQALAKLAGGSAHVSRLSSGMEVLYVLEERSATAVSLITDVGVRLAAERTASGRAMLAALPDAELKARVDAAGLGRQWQKIHTMVQQVRLRGWAEETEEVSVGQSSIAAAVLDHTGRPAAALAVTFTPGVGVDKHAELVTETCRRAQQVHTTLFGAA
ncbi:IclR family transcriptional regulator [uncultured Corynebacterium sp.]|uniref:IclR family transcriptional regulator n=1 Tax=uncultured Corynebacterium sp. TaxID=159447 RepID=UPI0028F16D18|nr:IclR family transcriptional regulator [uncultured Corynebacterium sp.]